MAQSCDTALTETRGLSWLDVVDVLHAQYLQPICAAKDSRRDVRFSFMTPIALIPLEGEALRVDQLSFAATKDFSEGGLGVVTADAIDADRLVVGLYIAGEPLFFSARITHYYRVSGRLSLWGLEVLESVDSEQYPELRLIRFEAPV